VAAIGQTLVIITGGIDMSIPWIFNAAAMAAFAFSNTQTGAGYIAALIGILVVGFLLGMINGVCVSYLGIPSIVMTLGMNTILQGAVTGLTSGSIVGAAPNILKFLSTGTFCGISAAFIFWLVLAVIVLLLLRKTGYGRALYALGNNRTVAKFSGIHVKRVEAIAYGISGMSAAMAGLLLLGKTSSAYLGMGNPFQFESIAAVALGGVAMSGGSGSYLGTIAGAMTIAVLLSVLTALNLSQAMQQILYGIILFVAVLVATIQNSRNKSSKL
jgi:ribose transport system permease protein